MLTAVMMTLQKDVGVDSGGDDGVDSGDGNVTGRCWC